MEKDFNNYIESLEPNSNTNPIEQVDTDDRADVSILRDKDGKICKYRYTIYRRNKAPLIGSLEREEMSLIYRLYSWYGASLTQRQISRRFPELSLIDFKRILRAFNITKASSPFAPHDIEEKSEEELREIQLREKENDFLAKIEEERLKDIEKLLNKYAKENIELKQLVNNRVTFLNECAEIEYDPISIKEEMYVNNDKTLILWLSDLHVGAYNEKFGYLPLANYDKEEILRRLTKVLYNLPKDIENIVVCNLGDNIDSVNKKTSRGTDLPTNMTNKEETLLYIDIMSRFMGALCSQFKTVSYYAVGESNHSGDFGWLAEIALSSTLQNQYTNIKTYVSNAPIDSFHVGNNSFIYLHGNDNKNQFKGFPLNLDVKTENWFLNYIREADTEFKDHIYVVKGDLHRYALTEGNAFTYMSVGSLYACSNWISANFGKTPWSVNYSIVDGNVLLNGVIKE